MRRLAVAAFVAVAVALIGAGATFAGSDHGHGHRGLSFFSTENSFAPVPVTAGKFSVGDRVESFSDDLFIAKGGAQVGTDGGECTTVRVTDAAAASGVLQCLVTFSLPGGQITTQALNTLTGGGFAGATGAITGGTGRYRGATGQFTVEFLSGGATNITFYLDD